MPSLRATLAFLLRWSGVLALWRWSVRKQIIIIAIHGTGTGTRSSWEPLRPQLSPEVLERCLKLLSRSYRFISMDEAGRMLAGKMPVQANSVVITFDDGYRNNLHHALPVLLRHHARALQYLPTGHVDERKPMWFDRLDFALQHASVDGRTIPIGSSEITIRGKDRDETTDFYARLRRLAKKIRPDRTMLQELDRISTALEEETAARLADVFEKDDWSSLVTWPEVRAAAGSIDFGSHTVNHIRIAADSREVAASELAVSRKRLEAETGLPCRHFAYPDGNFDSETASLVQANGYETAVTMEPGLNRVGDTPFQLKRIPVPLGGSDAELLLELSGMMNWLTSIRGALQKGPGLEN